MDQQTLLMAIAIVVILVAVWILFSGPSEANASKRVREVTGNEKEGALSFMKKEDTSVRRKQIEESLGEMEKAQKDKNKKRKSLKARIVQANWTITPQTYWIASLVLLVVFGGTALLLTGNPIAGAGVGLGIGYVVPRFVLNFSINRRQKKFLQGFADAMDIIVRGVRSGLPLGDCLKVIAHESPEPISSEFKLVVQGEQVGVPIEICLERMYERMPLPEVNFFSTVLAIQRQSGGNLGEALSNLSKVLRGRKILREKIKALSAEAKMSAGIIGSLPIVVMALITVMSPEYMWELYYTPTGHRNLAGSAVMMVLGTLIMRKMINFKI